MNGCEFCLILESYYKCISTVLNYLIFNAINILLENCIHICCAYWNIHEVLLISFIDQYTVYLALFNTVLQDRGQGSESCWMNLSVHFLLDVLEPPLAESNFHPLPTKTGESFLCNDMYFTLALFFKLKHSDIIYGNTNSIL